MKIPIIYTDQPLFGFDIGHDTLKVLQIEQVAKNKHEATGYGVIRFASESIIDGEIIDHRAVAKAAHTLFTKELVGEITSRRVAVSLPTSRSYNRIMNMPLMKPKDLQEAIMLETSQYIPIPIDSLYVDYDVIKVDEKSKTQEVLVVAIPRKLVDSYVKLFDILGLEPVLFETTIFANSRLVSHAEHSTGLSTLIIDFGSTSQDLCIIDTTLRVTGTVEGGGESFTKQISQALGVTNRQAHIIKTKYGLGMSKQQHRIAESLDGELKNLVSEIRKMVRFYTERSDSKKHIDQIILMGGGANMPGLSDYLTDRIRIPARLCSPWLNIGFGKLAQPHDIEKTVYVTAAGLALADPKKVLPS